MLKEMPRRPKYPQQALADKLRVAMADAGVNLADLARACGVTIQAVHDWRETGRVGKQHLMTICQVTKKPLEYFLSGLSRAASVLLLAIPPYLALQSQVCILCEIGCRPKSRFSDGTMSRNALSP
ncbi:MAG TPA: helix-turn-helix transcriptional regulator [Candidatus Binatia bacterium]|nr:helix-turn-helix transcriptional regulator [Candidatus Binatia bacterium]